MVACLLDIFSHSDNYDSKDDDCGSMVNICADLWVNRSLAQLKNDTFLNTNGLLDVAQFYSIAKCKGYIGTEEMNAYKIEITKLTISNYIKLHRGALL